MVERTPVVNISGDHEETILRLARHLGKNKLRRRVFNVIYGRGEKPQSKPQIMKAAGIPSRDTQQVQNALNHMSNHHLIVRTDNDGSVTDGSKNLYGRDLTVRANRAEIVRYADNPRAADKVATKRQPHLRGIVPIRRVTRGALRNKKKLSVLYLTANPDEANSIRVDAEVKQVQRAVRGSAFRDNISLEYRPAADLDSLMDGLNDLRPQVVHFSGHGSTRGLAVESGRSGRRRAKTVSFKLLAKALGATDTPPKIVVLNACESAGARKAFLPPAKMIVVMGDSVSDMAATAFAVQFYAAIAAGQSVKSAFQQGKVAVESVSITEADTPELLHASSVDPTKVKLT